MAKLRMIGIVLSIMTAFFFGSIVQAAEFHVTTSEGLKIALSVASDNLEDDIIYLGAGTYLGGFEYLADKAEKNALVLKPEDGLNPGDVVLDGGGTNRVFLFVDVYDNGDCTVEGITVQNGTGWFSGGLEISTGGDIKVSNCIISNNTSTRGGGISATTGAKITIENNTITGNTAGNGGGIYPLGGAVLVTGNTISNNTASGDGGAIRAAGSPVTISKNNMSGNSSTRGGAIYTFQLYGTTTIKDNTLTGNSASNGGGIYLNVENSILVNNVIADNEASLDGGGIVAYTYSGTATFTNNTVTGNSANDDGGGLYVSAASDSAALYIYNNIIRNNVAVDEGSDIKLADTGIKYGFNNDYAGLSGTWDGSKDNIDIDPDFQNESSGNYRLKTGSPCIDQGDNRAPSLPLTDKDGNSRMVDGNGDGKAVVDIGAYEFVPASTRSAVIPDIKANGSDGPITVAQGEKLSVTVSLAPGTLAGVDADWWVNAWTPFGWASYLYVDPSWVWILGLSATWDGPLYFLNPVKILDIDTLPQGDYYFFFGIDVDSNGSMDYFDNVKVVVGDVAGDSMDLVIPPSILGRFLFQE